MTWDYFLHLQGFTMTLCIFIHDLTHAKCNKSSVGPQAQFSPSAVAPVLYTVGFSLCITLTISDPKIVSGSLFLTEKGSSQSF